MAFTDYKGRFAPSPTGPLHAGSLVAALASWLDARAHGGQWLVRIEDVDAPRCVPGADQIILQQLAACGLHSDGPVAYQSARGHFYQSALDTLIAKNLAYPCACTRQDIALALAASGQTRQRHGELVYPGTCRHGLKGRPARAWRFLTDSGAEVQWTDRRLGDQVQNVGQEVGDFILKRADGLWAYQLAVVVDDAAQGITHVVRGEDLADNTARQILLQRALGYAQPQYMHTPLVLAADGEKLSKQNGAQPLNVSSPIELLKLAGKTLGLPANPHATTLTDWLARAIRQWSEMDLKTRQEK
ncbi:MAG: tRNA glutamyl-Q(34) synthetase GluQRS [Pseudomonadota bacterium]